MLCKLGYNPSTAFRCYILKCRIMFFINIMQNINFSYLDSITFVNFAKDRHSKIRELMPVPVFASTLRRQDTRKPLPVKFQRIQFGVMQHFEWCLHTIPFKDDNSWKSILGLIPIIRIISLGHCLCVLKNVILRCIRTRVLKDAKLK